MRVAALAPVDPGERMDATMVHRRLDLGMNGHTIANGGGGDQPEGSKFPDHWLDQA